MALPGPLSAAQLKRLEQHRYSATGRSLLDGLLQPYWAWLVERAPLWLAPNTITLAGFILNLIPSLILIAYCPTATEEVPRAGGASARWGSASGGGAGLERGWLWGSEGGSRRRGSPGHTCYSEDSRVAFHALGSVVFATGPGGGWVAGRESTRVCLRIDLQAEHKRGSYGEGGGASCQATGGLASVGLASRQLKVKVSLILPPPLHCLYQG